MKQFVLLALAASALTPVTVLPYRPDPTKQLGFPIYTNAPTGKQLSGDHAPAATPPVSPEETQKKFKVPPGFEVRLFASEPEVVNPVAMTWDERGRLWVLELYEYPMGAPKGKKGRDRIKILEDTDADGRVDKVSVFADGYSLATGLALGNGGVYLGVAPDFLFLEDTNGDDKADKTTVLKTGFGLEDRHELLNGFAWGPDGWLYMTHGVFTYSKVRDPNDPNDDGVRMNAALARYHPRTKKYEVFADGTSNPWGVDWNERGDAFVSACVIHHLFHMAPGGQYNRQGGTWANPYGYVSDLPTRGLPAIVDWRHYRAAHAGICIYQGDQWPSEWRGLVFLGNIHQNAINCDRLTSVGATYKAEKESKLLSPSKGDWEVGAGNFLVCDDHWFRPVSVQTGPDGAMWIMDWSDRYPCYQNAMADPEGVDRELGRIWRVVWVGDQPGKAVASRPEKDMNYAKQRVFDWHKLLDHPNSWQRRTAQRLLNERGPKITATAKGVSESAQKSGSRIEKTTGELIGLGAEMAFFGQLYGLANPKPAHPGKPLHSRLAALWTLHGSSHLSDTALAEMARDTVPEVRGWVARLTGEQASTSTNSARGLRTLQRLASDSEPTVRAAVACTLRQFSSSSLTVDTSPLSSTAKADLLPHFKELLARPSVEGDFYYPHIVWMAMEPRVAVDPQPFFPLLAANENSVTTYCLHRVMRRICDITDSAVREKHLNAAIEFLGGIASKTAPAGAALDGLIEAFKSKGTPPSVPLNPIVQKLTANPALADKARRLATLLGDTSASRTLIAKVNDPRASVDERLKGIQAASETKDEAAKSELLKLFQTPLTPSLSPPRGEGGRRPGEGSADDQQKLYTETVRALGLFNGDDIAFAIIDAWNRFNNATRRAAADLLVTRSKWSRILLAGVDKKFVNPQDISATARRALARAEDSKIREHADSVLGRYRATGEDKLKLIAEKRKVVLSSEPDMKAGYEIAKRTCFVCHKLHGEGGDVGPDLTGVGRSTLDALLHNTIDPNEIIGYGFENTEVELKDGRVLSGRIAEDTPTRLKLLASGPTEHVIAKSEIAIVNGKPAIRTSELSLMPEGLEQMPDADFRNLIWYILNPPQDNRPLTPQLRKELTGQDKP